MRDHSNAARADAFVRPSSDSTPAIRPLPSLMVEAAEGGAELIAPIADEWSALCVDEPFNRPEWVLAHIRSFAPESRLLLLTARAEGRLAAVLPLIERRERFLGVPVTILESASSVHSCRFDLVVAPGETGLTAARAILDHLRDRQGWTMIALNDTRSEGALARLTTEPAPGWRVARHDSISSPRFDLPAPEDDWTSWLSGQLAGKFRRELRRRTRQLEALGEVTLRRVDHADPTALREFYALEAAGWKGQQGTAISSSPATLSFYDDIARTAAQEGYLTMYFLDLDGRAIAAHLSLSYGGGYFTAKVAYDENFSRYSPGQQLVLAAARDASSRGSVIFDFLGPTMDWKLQWSDATTPLENIELYRRNAMGSLIHFMRHGWKPAARRLRAAVRRPSANS
jgi:CelD/BcsL family acetyltransferase involved in cellulose biosynthesis